MNKYTLLQVQQASSSILYWGYTTMFHVWFPRVSLLTLLFFSPIYFIFLFFYIFGFLNNLNKSSISNLRIIQDCSAVRWFSLS